MPIEPTQLPQHHRSVRVATGATIRPAPMFVVGLVGVLAVTLLASSCDRAPDNPTPSPTLTSDGMGSLVDTYRVWNAELRDATPTWDLTVGQLDVLDGRVADAVGVALQCIAQPGSSWVASADQALRGIDPRATNEPIEVDADCVAHYGITADDPMAHALTSGVCTTLELCANELDALVDATRRADVTSLTSLWSATYWDASQRDSTNSGLRLIRLGEFLTVHAYVSGAVDRDDALLRAALARVRYGISLLNGSPLIFAMLAEANIEVAISILMRLVEEDRLNEEGLQLLVDQLPVLHNTLPAFLSTIRSESLIVVPRLAGWDTNDPIGLAPGAQFYLQQDGPHNCFPDDPVPDTILETLGVNESSRALPDDADAQCAPSMQLYWATTAWMQRDLIERIDTEDALRTELDAVISEHDLEYVMYSTEMDWEVETARTRLAVLQIASAARLLEDEGVTVSLDALHARVPTLLTTDSRNGEPISIVVESTTVQVLAPADNHEFESSYREEGPMRASMALEMVPTPSPEVIPAPEEPGVGPR